MHINWIYQFVYTGSNGTDTEKEYTIQQLLTFQWIYIWESFWNWSSIWDKSYTVLTLHHNTDLDLWTAVVCDEFICKFPFLLQHCVSHTVTSNLIIMINSGKNYLFSLCHHSHTGFFNSIQMCICKWHSFHTLNRTFTLSIRVPYSVLLEAYWFF